ncbi:MAG: SGNH/GDSL hydrolase family protein [Rickettsia endosymbiont of Platyusa sonomae]|nr:SGNH/GDSL hydrolase family protein [Rickettsia endosymbiont of Platyusa sonomae]
MKLLKLFLISLLSLLITNCYADKKNSSSPLSKQASSSSLPRVNSQYRAVYIIGDSLSDTGAFVGSINSVLTTMKQKFPKLKWVDRIYFSPPFYKERSFSNGPVIVEYAIASLGLPITPGWSFSISPTFEQWILEQKSKELSKPLTNVLQKARLKNTSVSHDQVGTNYAVLNARASAGVSLPYVLFYNQFQLKNQCDALIKHHPDIGEDDLVIVMIGGNDIKEALFDKDPAGIISASISGIFEALGFLASKNVKHIVIANVPDVGSIPALVDTKLHLPATQLTREFNQKLNDQIENLRKIYPAIDIKLFDIYNVLQNIIVDYKKKGQNTSKACVSDMPINQGAIVLLELLLTGDLKASYVAPCNNYRISDYVFFDDVHSTTTVNQMAGKVLYNLIVK